MLFKEAAAVVPQDARERLELETAKTQLEGE
jgi:hypothetical protein